MSVLLDRLADGSLAVGTVFLLAAAVGMLRFPDFYSRLHAAGKGDTLGQALVVLALVIEAGDLVIAGKLALIAFFLFLLNPTATHALAHGAWVCGVRPHLGPGPVAFRQREGQLSPGEREALLEEVGGPPPPERTEGRGPPWTS